LLVLWQVLEGPMRGSKMCSRETRRTTVDRDYSEPNSSSSCGASTRCHEAPSLETAISQCCRQKETIPSPSSHIAEQQIEEHVTGKLNIIAREPRASLKFSYETGY
jgi:hypothetical protein